MDELSTDEAARELGVTVRRVERLVADGQLECVRTVGRAFLIDRASVRRLAERGTRRGRAWSPDTVRGAIDLLEGGAASWLSAGDRSRLRARLRGMTPRALTAVLAGRATVTRYSGVGSAVAAVAGAVALTGTSAVDADPAVASRFGLAMAPGMSGDGFVDGYVDSSTAEALVRDSHLWPKADGNVVLRVARGWEPTGGIAGDVLIALDLAESLAVRERSAGREYLAERLASLPGGHSTR